ncbi:hypothetical protein [Haloechinothrix sp. LS1_15]|uniref:hypothetical protein n=1 Tax=Haloechinothrix sp. LS1_15 TaxID=2652248 RepID=UPI0029461085|nr:hypothetical protein [Haloechinothrix sp. LS1_15]MDV6013586.1 hypothetical protein [Haloechinothrix sp. LS1_15]
MSVISPFQSVADRRDDDHMSWFWLYMLGIFALPLLTLVPWERLADRLRARRQARHANDPRPRMVRFGNGYYLDRGL